MRSPFTPDVVHVPRVIELGRDRWCGTIRLSSPAHAEGVRLFLESSDTSILQVHDIALVAGGTDLCLLFGDALQPGLATLTVRDEAGRRARWQKGLLGNEGVERSARIAVAERPGHPSLRCFEVPAEVAGHHERVCHLQLDQPAGPWGFQVALASSDPEVIAVPETVTVPMNRAWVPVPVRAGQHGQATIRVTVGNDEVDFPVRVRPLDVWTIQWPAVLSTSPLERTAISGRLTGPAPPGGLRVPCASDDPDIVSVIPEFRVPAGACDFIVDVTPCVPGDTTLDVFFDDPDGRALFGRSWPVWVAHAPRWTVHAPGPILLDRGAPQHQGMLVTLHHPAPAGGASLLVRTSDAETVAVQPNDDRTPLQRGYVDPADSAELELTFAEGTVTAWVHLVGLRPGSAILTCTDGVVTTAHTLLVERGDPPQVDRNHEPYQDNPFLVRHFLAGRVDDVSAGQVYWSVQEPNDGDPQVPTFVTSTNPAVVAAPYRQDDRGRRLFVAGRPGEAEIHQQSLFDRGWAHIVVQEEGALLGSFTLPPLLGVQRGQRFAITALREATTWFRCETSDASVLAVEPVVRIDGRASRTAVFRQRWIEVTVDTLAPGHAVVSVDDGVGVSRFEVEVVPVTLRALELTGDGHWEVRLSGVAPREGYRVALHSTDAAVVAVPDHVVVPEGASVVEFHDFPLAAGTSEIRASAGGVTIRRSVTLWAAESTNERAVITTGGHHVTRGASISQDCTWADRSWSEAMLL